MNAKRLVKRLLEADYYDGYYSGYNNDHYGGDGAGGFFPPTPPGPGPGPTPGPWPGQPPITYVPGSDAERADGPDFPLAAIKGRHPKRHRSYVRKDDSEVIAAVLSFLQRI